MTRAGIGLLLAGAVVVAGYIAYVFVKEGVLNSAFPLALKIGLLVIGVGVIVLLLAAIRDRALARRNESWKQEDAEP